MRKFDIILTSGNGDMYDCKFTTGDKTLLWNDLTQEEQVSTINRFCAFLRSYLLENREDTAVNKSQPTDKIRKIVNE